MPDYDFALAGRSGRILVHLRAALADDAAAASHALALAQRYPEASWATIACGDRIVGQVRLNTWDDGGSVGQYVRESEARITQSRKLLEATARPAWSIHWQGRPEA